jgi:hypothetical protein
MSFLHRAPRQVYHVYGEDEHLAEEHMATESEGLQEVEESGSCERRPEIGLSPPTGSRVARLAGVGLLLGISVGAAGLVLSHLTHEASPPRRGSSGPSTVRRMPAASSGSFPRRAFGGAPADPESASHSTGRSMSHAPVSGHASSARAAERHVSGSVAAKRERPSRQSAPTWRDGSTWRMHEAASAAFEASVSFAASGGEFEFER